MTIRRIAYVTAALLAVLAMAGGYQRYARRATVPEVLPRSAVVHLSLRPDEVPAGYGLLRDTAFLAGMGMTENPDYVGNRAELEALAARGGLASFLAVYGPSAPPRLMVNGVFFRSGRHLEEFVRFQQKKQRPMAMFRRPQRDGVWLLLVARDREAVYSAAEQAEITAGLRRYQQRISCECLAEDLWNHGAAATLAEK